MPRIAPAVLIAAFALSGCAALVYQIAWLELLGLVIGTSAPSLGVLLGTIMGGLCLGSLLAPRLVPARAHPLRVLGLIELAVAALALVVLLALPGIGTAYAAVGGGGFSGLALRAAAAALCLLPPTVLMGATLPVAGRWVEPTAGGAARLGVLYAANVAGGVAGCVLAAFYLLRAHDSAFATFAAAGSNAAAGLACLALSARVPSSAAAAAALPPGAAAPHAPGWPVYAAAALSGATALAAEVLWTRHLALLLGGTVYTFALILAVFLLGLGAGGAAGSAWSRRASPGAALGGCQLLAAAAIAWAAFTIARSLPYWPLDPTLASSARVALELDLLRTALPVLPGAVLWGASFPLALAALAERGRQPGRCVGPLYAANTAGAILGALATSFVLVVSLGGRGTQQLAIVLSAGAGLLVLASHAARPVRRAAWLGAGAAAALVFAVPALPPELAAFGRFMPTRSAGAEVIYVREGITGPVAVSRQATGALTYHNAGKAQASTYPQDVRLERMLGHLTTLTADDPRSVLVIGLGAGITAGAVALDPGVARVVVAEIEPLAREVAAEHFAAHNFGVVRDPKVELVVDDGRHFLATTSATFDGITSDPLDPWAKGAAALYTREFWRLAKSRLNPGGTVTAFLQLYETTEDAVRSAIATFFEVFPNGAVFANTVRGAGYDAVLLGRAGDAPLDVDRLERRLRSAGYERVAASLREVGFASGVDLLATFAGGRAELGGWLDGAAINTDRNLRLQYLAGAGLNANRADVILHAMLAGAAEPAAGPFAGDARRLQALEHRIRARRAEVLAR